MAALRLARASRPTFCQTTVLSMHMRIFTYARAGWPRRLAAPAGRAMGAIDHNPSYISAYRPLAMLGAPAGWPLAALGTHHFA
jgi:hypothetical protein